MTQNIGNDSAENTENKSAETLATIVATTRDFLTQGSLQEAASYSGEAVARLHERWSSCLREHTPSAAALADTLFAVDNHLRVLFTSGMFTEIFSTAIVALAQAAIDPSFSPHATNADDATRLVADGRMLLLADAVSALTRYVEDNPPLPDSPEAAHMSAMLTITASLLFDAYRQVNSQSPANPDLPEVYTLLRQFQEMGAIATTIDIQGIPTPISDIGSLLGDLLGRALALGWIGD